MNPSLRLLLTTPQRVLVDCVEVVALRGEDASGSFGLRPGHIDYLTALVPTVLRWRLADGTTRFCAVGGGVLSLTDGLVRVACREAVAGEHLADLEARVRQMRENQEARARQTRIEHLRLHTRAVRQLVRYLRAGEETPFRSDGEAP